MHGFLCSFSGLLEDLLAVLLASVLLLLLLELRDGVHLRLGLHLAQLGRVVVLHHQHVGHLAIFLLADGKSDFRLPSRRPAPELQLELDRQDKELLPPSTSAV